MLSGVSNLDSKIYKDKSVSIKVRVNASSIHRYLTVSFLTNSFPKCSH